MNISRVTFSNYINVFYHCECLECGKKKEIKQSKIVVMQ